MNLENDTQLANTRMKLRSLEEHYELSSQDRSGTPQQREISLRSIKRIINQLKEEIALYECRVRELAKAS
jgi:hypothetical protein